MDVLGHDDIDHAELYSREASQVRLAVQGMDRVVRVWSPASRCLANLLANLVANHPINH
ncbi:hypothetical protein CK216_13675 [Mesorhizobium sp. WSM3876]|nr:hypothetical protein CK216_13675 [Mesorhizobium sp. WSM3876]